MRVGVVADTHVPDRVNALHPALLPALRAAGVDCILHAGDISSPQVLTQLREIAPVEMARGNRDWAFRASKKWVNQLQLGGVRIALMHGHISWAHYLWDKWPYLIFGYRLARYKPLLLRAAQGARVIVFGHTHFPENIWVGKQLLFNPGSASFGFRKTNNPSWGIVDIYSNGAVEGKLLELKGFRLVKGGWIVSS